MNLLEEYLKQRILASGPISVAEYMQAALGHPSWGYYMRREPFGKAGDFITAPEVSQVFGELVGVWCADAWMKMKSPRAALVEIGPGRGTLMKDALRATRHIEGFHDAIDVHLVETSPALREVQRTALSPSHPRIHWHERVDTLPNKPLLIVANELFDALPVRQFVKSGEGYRERLVGYREGKGFIFVDAAQNAPAEALPEYIPDDAEMIERNEAGEALMAQIAVKLMSQWGVMLMLDYGYRGGSRANTLQAVKDHRYANPLADPGEADLTAHVDFDALSQAALVAGAGVYGPISQGRFLTRMGARERTETLCANARDDAARHLLRSGLERLVAPQQMGELFKAMAVVHPGVMPAVFAQT